MDVERVEMECDLLKTATRHYPMAYLSRAELQDRGDRKGLVTRGSDGQPSLLAFVWMDRQRRYFVSTASSLDAAGAPYIRIRWRQVDESPNSEPTRVELAVPQPKAAEIYYDACAMADRQQSTSTGYSGIGGQSWYYYSQLGDASELVNLCDGCCRHLACLQPVHRHTRESKRLLHHSQ